MENKIPTAEEFYKSIVGESPVGYTEEAMIEFAKLHVEMALREASDTKISGVYSETKYKRGDNDKNSILNGYPLTNIK
jgi:hypothetical protein